MHALSMKEGNNLHIAAGDPDFNRHAQNIHDGQHALVHIWRNASVCMLYTSVSKHASADVMMNFETQSISASLQCGFLALYVPCVYTGETSYR